MNTGRRRLEQQRIRRKQFYRRWRRIVLLHNHFKKNSAEQPQIDLEEMTTLESFHRPVVERQRQRFSFNKEVTPFWLEIVNNEMNDDVFQQYFHMTKATFDFIY